VLVFLLVLPAGSYNCNCVTCLVFTTFSGNPGNLYNSENSETVREKSWDLSCHRKLVLFEELLTQYFIYLDDNSSTDIFRKKFNLFHVFLCQ